MTSFLKGKNINYAGDLFVYFLSVIKDDSKMRDEFFDLNSLSTVKKFPSRVKCATLIWHSLRDLIGIDKNQ